MVIASCPKGHANETSCEDDRRIGGTSTERNEDNLDIRAMVRDDCQRGELQQ